VAGHPAVRLAPDSAPFAFAGDVPAQAQPHGASVVDLNVMTRRGRFVAAVRRVRVAAQAPFTLAAHTTLIFALARLTVSTGETTADLSRWDAVSLAGPARCILWAPAAAAQAYLIEISAAPSPR
jgi:environmental stress-induced protein Ves